MLAVECLWTWVCQGTPHTAGRKRLPKIRPADCSFSHAIILRVIDFGKRAHVQLLALQGSRGDMRSM